MICDHRKREIIAALDQGSLCECLTCGLVFSDRLERGLESRDLYETYYRNELGGRFSWGIEHIVRAFRFFRAFKMFTISPRAARILDIGSGRGFMLYYLKKYYRYTRTVGTQISRNAYEFSRNKLGLEIYDKDLLELSFDPGSFDIVTLWHVLEHLAQPARYMDAIRNVLAPGGKLVIEVPNYGSWTRAWTGKYWLGLDPDYHMYFFTPASLVKLVTDHGFTVKTIHTFSLEYSTFISVQSIISLITRSNHLFFRSLENGGAKRPLVLHALLFAVLTPICLLINLLLYFARSGEVLLIIAEKE
jgi:SAM-dependent methyltransferase